MEYIDSFNEYAYTAHVDDTTLRTDVIKIRANALPTPNGSTSARTVGCFTDGHGRATLAARPGLPCGRVRRRVPGGGGYRISGPGVPGRSRSLPRACPVWLISSAVFHSFRGKVAAIGTVNTPSAASCPNSGSASTGLLRSS